MSEKKAGVMDNDTCFNFVDTNVMVATALLLEHVTTVLSAMTLICALVAIQRESFLEGKYTFFVNTDPQGSNCTVIF